MNIAYGNWQQTHSQINKGTQSVSNDITENPTNLPVINIHVSCTNLKKLDVGNASDPMIVLFIPYNGQEVEVSRTEVIWNSSHPQFVKFFQAMYIFQTYQPLKFMIYDVDSEKSSLQNHQIIGYVETNVQSLISNCNSSITFEIQHPSHQYRGELTITVEQAVHSGSYFDSAINVSKLKKMKTFSKDNPYIQFSKPSESGSHLPVYRTEVIKGAYRCTFDQFCIPITSLCNSDLTMPIKITVMNYSSKKEDEPIGSYTASLNSIVSQKGTTYNIVDSRNKNTGELTFLNPIVIKKPTFFDYLRSGIQLNLITAIDFTASNRDPEDPRSLHFLKEGCMNQYENCIWSVGSIICPYDKDQLFSVYGFGAKVNGTVNHCFPLNFNDNNPTVNGLSEIVETYKKALSSILFSGPTLFSPIIKKASATAISSFRSSLTYTILLILTDGVINDMKETIDAIVEASKTPLSIIIVGVGNADFGGMEMLDADKNKLASSTNEKAARDIVQFVPFNKFAGNGVILASEVLAEIPKQVDQYCAHNGFIPHY